MNFAWPGARPPSRATPLPGFAARCSRILNTVSASSGFPIAFAISSAVAGAPSPFTTSCWSASTSAAAFFPASTPGWWYALMFTSVA